jgi:predicted Zn-dependent protease
MWAIMRSPCKRNALAPVPGLISAAGNAAGWAVDAALSHDAALAQARLAELTLADLAVTLESSGVAAIADYAWGLAAAGEQDWRAASHWFEQSEAEAQHVAQVSNETFNGKYLLAVLDGPWLAYSAAKLGLQTKADAILATLAPDCYLCNRMRGRIDASRRNWNGAAFWFGKAAAQAPSIPFAFADWGAMLMEKGDLDGAIEKFKTANAKGPHFADPLELWGEALMLENRSDLALAKFAEANNDASNWGRLHLKWGEALLWSGNKADAKKQFAVAAQLDLSAADSAALARVSAMGSKL